MRLTCIFRSHTAIWALYGPSTCIFQVFKAFVKVHPSDGTKRICYPLHLWSARKFLMDDAFDLRRDYWLDWALSHWWHLSRGCFFCCLVSRHFLLRSLLESCLNLTLDGCSYLFQTASQWTRLVNFLCCFIVTLIKERVSFFLPVIDGVFHCVLRGEKSYFAHAIISRDCICQSFLDQRRVPSYVN